MTGIGKTGQKESQLAGGTANANILEFTNTTALVGGNVYFEGLTTVTEKGVYWGLYPNPEISGTKLPIADGPGSYSAILSGIDPNTTYYVKAYAINSVGIAYGSQYSFNTGQNTKISDIDSNVYHFITIGFQVWMTENLKATKFNDGTIIPNVTDDGL